MPLIRVRPSNSDTERGKAQSLRSEAQTRVQGEVKNDEDSCMQPPQGDWLCCDRDVCDFCHRRNGLGDMSPLQWMEVLMFALQCDRANEVYCLQWHGYVYGMGMHRML